MHGNELAVGGDGSHGYLHIDPLSISSREAQVLRELADGRTEQEVALSLDMSYHGVRSAVGRLKAKTGTETVRELGRWWRSYRLVWVESMEKAAGR